MKPFEPHNTPLVNISHKPRYIRDQTIRACGGPEVQPWMEIRSYYLNIGTFLSAF